MKFRLYKVMSNSYSFTTISRKTLLAAVKCLNVFDYKHFFLVLNKVFHNTNQFQLSALVLSLFLKCENG